METNRVANQTTKIGFDEKQWNGTMELTKMRLIRYLEKKQNGKENKQSGYCQNQNLN